MTYTEEQLKKISEWLGRPAEIPIKYLNYGGFNDWLHSPEGQSAVIDKLVDEFIKVIIYRNYCDEDANAVCCLIIPESQWRAKRDDPREALIAAVLEMLEAE